MPHILRMAQGLFRVVLALSVVMLGQHNGLNADADRDALHIVMANTTPPLVLAQAANADLTLNVDVSSDTNLGVRQVANGDKVTFSLLVSRASGGQKFDDVSLQIKLFPATALIELACPGYSCTPITQTLPVQTPTNEVYSQTIDTGWQTSLRDFQDQGKTTQVFRQFTGRLVGQPDGSQITATVTLRYIFNGIGQEIIRPVVLTARNNLPNEGRAQVAQWPSWRANEAAGVFSQDWGDFDRDGDPDLALGYWAGARVYRNDNGILMPFYTSTTASGVYAVRWADVEPGGNLELLEAGSSTDETSGFLKVLAPGSSAQPITYTSPAPIAHIVAAQFVGDSARLDVIANNAKYDTGCPIIVFTDTNLAGGCVGSPFQPTVALNVVYLPNKTKTLYLVTSGFANNIQLFSASSNVFTSAFPINDAFNFPPYDFAWGDYDNNGVPDLAAAFPLQNEVRIYAGTESNGSYTWSKPQTIPVSGFFSPLSLDWVNVDNDDDLDLVIASQPPRVYMNDAGTFKQMTGANLYDPQGQIWSLRATHARPSLDPSFLAANVYQPSWLYDGLQPRLDAAVSSTTAIPGNFYSVAVGDVDGDGRLDRVMGAENGNAITIVTSQHGTVTLSGAGNGPQQVSLGDVNSNFTQDLAVGSNGLARIYRGASSNDLFLRNTALTGTAVLALGDADGDLRLDAAVGSSQGGAVQVFTSTGSFTAPLSATPAWTAPIANGASILAWADVDRDHNLDLLVVDGDRQTARLYRNTGNQTNANAMFELVYVYTSSIGSAITSAAFGDVNQDGFPDLALSSANSIRIYESQPASRTLAATSVVLPSVPITSNIHSLAWGDWNNDGLPDLAVGDASGPARVYANVNSRRGQIQMTWVWASAENTATTGVAWGDMDNDGWQDLVVSRSSGPSGIYFNTTRAAALPRIELHRPGRTRDAGDFSSSEIVGDQYRTIQTSVFTVSSPLTDLSVIPRYAFSKDNGSTWVTRTLSTIPILTQVTTKPMSYTLIWDLRSNQAVGNDARLRVSLIPTGTTRQPDLPVAQA